MLKLVINVVFWSYFQRKLREDGRSLPDFADAEEGQLLVLPISLLTCIWFDCICLLLLEMVRTNTEVFDLQRNVSSY